MTDRVNCINEDCERNILPATAKRTGGFCMPCVQAKERKQRQKYIEENRRDIDPFLGVDDSIEIIKLHHVERVSDPLIRYIPFQGKLEDVYAKLTELEIEHLIDLSIQEAGKGELRFIEEICLELASFRACDLTKLHDFMLLNHLYYPANIFHGARPEISQRLITLLDEDSENKNHILFALAWSGNEDVVDLFSAWLKEPPAWASQLYIPPYGYSKEAGWEITPSHSVRKLYFEPCYPLVAAQGSKQSSHSNLKVCSHSVDKCEWCSRNLTHLLEIDLSERIFSFLELSGEKLKLSTCDTCASYTDALYMNFDTDGNSSWSKHNPKPEYLPEDADEWGRLPENGLVLSSNTRPAHYAAHDFLPTTFSQIGGMPTWVQDSAYATCPGCQTTMMFIAQISNEEIQPNSEGTYYVYICRDCQISATNYQQT